MINEKTNQTENRRNKPIYQGEDEVILRMMAYLLRELTNLIDHGIIYSESVDSVKNDIDQKQLEISKLKERISKIETYIKGKRNHLNHLKKLNSHS